MDRFIHEFEDGLAHLRAGRWEAAVGCLRVAARREPGRVAIAQALATACLCANDPQGARDAVRNLTLEAPMCAEAWRLAAQLEWKLGKYDQAMSVLARGLEQLPHSAILQKQTALFWGARGKMENAAGRWGAIRADDVPAPREGDWLDRVAMDSKMLESVLNSPDSADDLDMLKSLETKLSALLKSQPYHADRQVGLARLQVKIGALHAGMESVQRALRANPEYIEAVRLRATILGKLGEYDAAIEVLESLIRRGMDWADIHCELAQMQKARGRAEEARSHLYSAIRVNPGFERAKQMLEKWAA
jgi:tetratricopeptide (TPR) repeat protein